MRHLILGNGASGMTAAQKLRELNPEDEITILSSEDTPTYAKIMLPDYIGGKIQLEKLFLRDLEFYKANRINLCLNSVVEAVDTVNKQVFSSGGRVDNYDRLLLSVGGVSFIPPVPGLSETEYFTINSLKDAENIRRRAESGKKALIIGAGLTGIEMAFALKRLGMDVEIVDRLERILPQQLDQYSSRAMTQYLKDEGIGMLLGRTLAKVVDIPNKNKAVELDDGQRLEYDMLILAIGTRQNIGILNTEVVKCNRGVLVDEYMKTSAPDVFAAGDIAEAVNKLSKEYVSCYIWPNAMAQGKCAAFNMAGQPQEFSNTALAQSSVQLRDIPFMSMGMVNAEGEGIEVLIQEDKGERVYKRIILKDNVVKGMVFLGDTTTANTVAGLIRKGTDVSGYKQMLLRKDFSAK